jgi:fatty acid-binding protein DegV
MKSKCGILIDSSCTYAQEFIDNNHIEVVPLSLSDEQQHVYQDDSKVISQQELLARLSKGEIFKTSATPLGQLTLKIEDMLERYETVIFLPISYGLSSQYQQAAIIKNDYPNRLFVIQSQSAVCANEFILHYIVQ